MKKAVYAIVLVVIFGAGIVLAVRSLTASGEGDDVRLASAREAIPAREHADVREPVVAGQFYPSDAEELASTVDSFLQQADTAGPAGEVVAIVAPHAGYQFSGGVAGHAFAAVRGKSYETVVVLGPSHGERFAGAALPEADRWQTPLGEVEIDRTIVRKLLQSGDCFFADDGVMGNEHSIEVELPFLQRALTDFRLVPIQVFDVSEENLAAISGAVYRAVEGRTALLVASTDMSHYPAYEDACRVDNDTLELMKGWKIRDLLQREGELAGSGIRNLDCGLCGVGPVAVTLDVARRLGADTVEVLKYANSGDVAQGDKARCVGYCAVALCDAEGNLDSEVQLLMNKAPNEGETPEMTYEEGELDREQQEYVLGLARRAIRRYVEEGERIEAQRRDGIFGKERAVFVTLRERGELRGCIGSLEAQEPLVDAVVSRAIAAATQDPRFPPVEARELPLLKLEVSVLSPMRQIEDASEIELGKHGIVVKQGWRSGVFLPEVAVDQGWDLETTLRNLCAHKAGLPADAWKDDAELLVFTTQSFGDKH